MHYVLKEEETLNWKFILYFFKKNFAVRGKIIQFKAEWGV